MTIFNRYSVKSLYLALIGAFALSTMTMSPVFFSDSEANAQQNRNVVERPKQKVAPQMTPEVFKIFEDAQEAADAGDKISARSLIDRLLSKKGLSSYEEALGHNFRGFLYFQEENFSAALREYEYIMTLPNLPYQFSDGILYTMAQLHMVQENYDRALNIFLEWYQYQANPNTSSLVLGGQLYYMKGQELEKAKNLSAAIASFDRGIPFIESAIDYANVTEGVEPRENWYQLLSAMYYSKKDYRTVTDILEIVIVKWPRPQYWVQLSAMYSELGEADKQLAVMDVAYRLGFLDKDKAKTPENKEDADKKDTDKNSERARGNANIINMVSLYNFNGAPYLSAKTLEKAIEDGEAEKDNQKNQKALGEAWLTSREYQKSAGPLELAARDSEDGELYLQLGFVYSTLEDWSKTARSIQRAVNKGDLKNEGQAYLYLGMAFFNMEDFKKAEDAFNQARRFDATRRSGTAWINYIKNEKARLIRLADAGIR